MHRDDTSNDPASRWNLDHLFQEGFGPSTLRRTPLTKQAWSSSPVRLISTSWSSPGVRAHRLQPPSVSHSRWIQACLQHLLDFSHQYSVSSEYLGRRAKSVSDSYYQSQELSRQQPQELLAHQPQPAYFQRILSPSHLIRQASGPLDV
jgi:hypothetical protein